MAITTWPTVGGGFFTLKGDLFAFPFTHPITSAVTSATPLGLLKFEAKGTEIASLILGNRGGSVGETAALIILACGAYLALRNYLNWRIPASILATVAVLSAILHAVDPHRPDALFMLFSGGLMLGAIYMATDMVTSPVTNGGRWVFGVGIGILVVVIRVWGGLPEGVMYAILFMNALVPFINRATQPRVFGTRVRSDDMTGGHQHVHGSPALRPRRGRWSRRGSCSRRSLSPVRRRAGSWCRSTTSRCRPSRSTRASRSMAPCAKCSRRPHGGTRCTSSATR